MKSLFHSNLSKSLLEKYQLADLDSIFNAGETSYNRHKGRCVKCLDFQDENNQASRLFLKLYWGRRRIWPRMTDLKTGQVFQTLAEREWNGLKTVSDLGIPTAERMALFSDGKFFHRSAIILKEVPVPDCFHDWVASGKWSELPRFQKSLLLDKMIETVQTIHHAGYGWRGASTKHFYPSLNENNRWDVWIIDCEGVFKTANPKAFQQNYENLIKSMHSSNVEKEFIRELEFKANYVSSNLSKAA